MRSGEYLNVHHPLEAVNVKKGKYQTHKTSEIPLKLRYNGVFERSNTR
jgi:hypothetical protein